MPQSALGCGRGNAHQRRDRAGALGLERGGGALFDGGGRVFRTENARATQILDLVLMIRGDAGEEMEMEIEKERELEGYTREKASSMH